MTFFSPASTEILGKYKGHVKRILCVHVKQGGRPSNKEKAIKQGGKVVGVKKKLVWRRKLVQ